MKKLFSISIFGFLLVMTLGLNTTITHAQTPPIPGIECTNATEFVTTTAGPGIKYDKSSISVSKDTCVQITLVNQDMVIHDFVIEGVSGDGGIEQVYMTTNVGETAHFKVTTPNIDVTFEFYCWQPGHRAAGMAGNFVVGTGESVSDIEESTSLTTIEETKSQDLNLPSFTILISLGSMFTILIVRSKLKNKYL